MDNNSDKILQQLLFFALYGIVKNIYEVRKEHAEYLAKDWSNMRQRGKYDPQGDVF